MNRVIKFPLIMDDEKEVRTINELRENFNLKKVLEYYLNGKLKIWLQQRSYEEELSKLERIDSCTNSEDIPSMLCKIFNVEQSVDIKIHEIKRRESRLSFLRSFSDDEEWEKKLDYIAFTQKELDEKLMNENSNINLEDNDKKATREIYLCGEVFEISDKFKNIKYIGVNTPLVSISSCSTVFDAKSNNIKFENVKITSDVKMQILTTDTSKFEIDDSKIITKKIWNEIPTIIEGDKFDKILIYKDKLIGKGEVGFASSCTFEIIKISNRYVLMDLSSLAPIFSEDRTCNEIKVCAMVIFNSILICLCIDHPNSYFCDERMVYINLETLEIEKYVKIPKENRLDYNANNISVYEDKIFIYSNEECKYYELNTGKYLGSRKVQNDRTWNLPFTYHEIVNIQFYEGNLYKFRPEIKMMITDNESFIFKGFKKVETQNESYPEDKIGKIGTFDIFGGKVVTTSCYFADEYGVRIADNSIVKSDGYIVMYDITGGDVIKSKKVSNSIIRLIKYYKGILVIISEDMEVRILNADTLDILNSFKLSKEKRAEAEDEAFDDLLKLAHEHSKKISNLFGCFSEEIDVCIDNNSDKMAVFYDKQTIYIYE